MGKIFVLIAVVAIALFFFKKRKSAAPVETTKEAEKAVEMRQDPVCGSYVEESTHYKVRYYDKFYYFCSEECKNKFIEQKRQENNA